MPADVDERTESPTPRRREQSRSRGQVARSQDLSAAAPLLVSFAAISLLGPRLWYSLLAMVRTGLVSESSGSLDDLHPFAGAVMLEAARRLTPFLVVVVAAIVAISVAQIGLLFTVHPLIPSLSKINPLEGVKRLFSARSVVAALVNMGKLLVVAFIVYLTFAERAASILFASTLGLIEVFRLGARLTFDVGIRLSVALVVLALLDFAWQRHRREKDLRMTKEEVKDEFRSMEGDPKLKARRRQAQIQLAMQRVRRDVPTADVVVTNPTHVAVAIRYDSETMVAPKVVAKGADYLALRIRQVAKEFGIPLVERPPLARALHEAVEVGQYVPERFYRAIAEILAYVYELTGRSPRVARRRFSEAGR